jgi:hypothetical protein
MLTLRFLLLLIAFMLFVAATFNVPTRGINLVAAGLAVWMMSLLVT